MTFTVSATDTLKDIELPKPVTPNYFVVNQDFSGTHNDYITMYAAFDDSLVKLYTEYDVDSEAFFKKYGIENEGYYDFFLDVQYDVNVNGNGWQYVPEWDEVDGYTGSYAEGYDYTSVRTERFYDFTLADLYQEEARELYTPHRSRDPSDHRYTR